MLTRPDFLQKQIVVISSYELHQIRFANENLIIEAEGVIKNQASLHKIFAIFVIGEATITTHLIRKLKAFGVALVLLKKNLELVDVIGGDDMNGNILLREKQYTTFRDRTSAVRLARHCITNKIQNQEALLRKIAGREEIHKNTALRLHSLALDAFISQSSERLLGIEGNAAKYFFHEVYRNMDWIGRYPRTKIDANNVLLDLGYTFLFHFVEAILALYGFDLYEGFYHKRFYQRKSLVCDIEEPFRPIIDEALRKAYNLGQVSKKDFGHVGNTFFIAGPMIGKYTKIFARALLDHKEDIYDYVYGFYRHILDPSRAFPTYQFR